MTPPLDSPRTRRLFPVLAFGVPLACLLWAFGSTLAELAQTWSSNPQYSHGYLVPVFALLLLWLRRDRVDLAAFRPSWLGLPLLAAGIGLRLAGTYYYYSWIETVSLLPCLVGVWLMAGGLPAWRWGWPALLFLLFMIPLPYRLAVALSGPLQRLATVSSTYVMQCLGLPALSEGNVILLNDAEIGIVEACSGLRMLVVFFALATAVALVIRRPLLDKLILVASAVPIALVSNVIRITATGFLHEIVSSEFANKFFHDFAGWLMMPLALALLGLEIKVLAHLFIDPPVSPFQAVPQPQARRKPYAAPARARQASPPASRERAPVPATVPSAES